MNSKKWAVFFCVVFGSFCVWRALAFGDEQVPQPWIHTYVCTSYYTDPVTYICKSPEETCTITEMENVDNVTMHCEVTK